MAGKVVRSKKRPARRPSQPARVAKKSTPNKNVKRGKKRR